MQRIAPTVQATSASVPLLEKSGISMRYAADTWRREQSIIDILQNHLDAQKSLKQNLPRIYVQMKHERGPSRWVRYEELLQRKNRWGAQWHIVALRVHDRGPGYDHKVLSAIGFSSKSLIKGDRGGLGEGLKLASCRLAAEGVAVTLGSRHARAEWELNAKPSERELLFEGHTNQASLKKSNPTGAYSILNFSKLPTDALQEYQTIIDPRRGEGLGKYVLELRGSRFFELAAQPCELTRYGVPKGRIYVRGLLVEERDDLLFSYNGTDPKLLTGRDRKTTHPALLSETVDHIFKIQPSPPLLIQFWKAFASGVSCKEQEWLPQIPSELSKNYRGAEFARWRETFDKAIGFDNVTTLLTSNETHHSLTRFAEERGKKVIRLLQNSATVDQIADGLGIAKSNLLSHFVEKVRPPKVSNVQVADGETVRRLCKLVYRDLAQNYPSALVRHINPDSIKVDVRPSDQYEGPAVITADASDLRPDSDYIVSPKRSSSLLHTVQTCAELQRELVGSRVYDPTSQGILTNQVGDLLLQKIHPRVVENISKIKIPSVTPPSRDYSPIKAARDNALINFNEELQQYAIGGIPKGELAATAKRWSEYHNLNTRNIPRKLLAISDNQLFRMNLENGTFSLVRLSNSARKGTVGVLHLEPTKRRGGFLESRTVMLEDNRIYALPITNHEGEYRLHATPKKFCTILQHKGKIGIRGMTRPGDAPLNLYSPQGAADSRPRAAHFGMRLGAGVIEIDTVRKGKFYFSKNAPRGFFKGKEKNFGQEAIFTSLCVEYGNQGGVIDSQETSYRVAYDILQNHLDAGGGAVPRVDFEVRTHSGTQWITVQELRELPYAKVTGLSFRDSGPGYTTQYLELLGESGKDKGARGRFGEGLKLAALVGLRHGLEVQFSSHNWTARAAKYSDTVFNTEKGLDSPVSKLKFDLSWGAPQNGAQTVLRLPEAQTEYDDFGYASKTLWSNILRYFDPRKTDSSMYLRGNERASHGVLADFISIPSGSGWGSRDIYERGVFVAKNEVQFAIHTINSQVDITDTRERNHINQDLLLSSMQQCSPLQNDPVVVSRVMHDSSDTFLEHTAFLQSHYLDGVSKAIWRREFYRAFGINAILSVENVTFEHRKKSGRYLDGIAEGASYEKHLPPALLITLPPEIACNLVGVVHSSVSEAKGYDAPEIKLSPVDARALWRSISSINQFLALKLESALQRTEWRKAIEELGVYRFQVSLHHLRTMTPEQLRLKQLGPNLSGLAGSGFETSLNASLLAHPRKLVETYLHELVHHLSGEQDYTAKFQIMYWLIWDALNDGVGLAEISKPQN